MGSMDDWNVGESVWGSLRVSVRNSVRHSMLASVWYSVWHPMRNPAVGSMRNPVWDSIRTLNNLRS